MYVLLCIVAGARWSGGSLGGAYIISVGTAIVFLVGTAIAFVCLCFFSCFVSFWCFYSCFCSPFVFFFLLFGFPGMCFLVFVEHFLLFLLRCLLNGSLFSTTQQQYQRQLLIGRSCVSVGSGLHG